jgi:hypothetical protein
VVEVQNPHKVSPVPFDSPDLLALRTLVDTLDSFGLQKDWVDNFGLGAIVATTNYFAGIPVALVLLRNSCADSETSRDSGYRYASQPLSMFLLSPLLLFLRSLVSCISSKALPLRIVLS